MKDIADYETFTKIEAIHKGWSSDKKYYVETADGKKLLLRISDISEYEDKKREFDIIGRMSAVGINMYHQVDFGICNDKKSVYQLLTWVEGEEAKELLPSLSQKEQYDFGWEAGQMMLKMQRAESYPPSSEWAKIYGKRVEKYIEAYKACGETSACVDLLLSFLEKRPSSLDNRPMCLLHADFQSDNMIISPKKELYAIDFQGSGPVDPYYALGAVMVTAEVSPQFSTGQLHSYFGGSVPDDFWELNAYYMAAESINAFTVAAALGQEERDCSNEMMKAMLDWFDNFNNLIPSWYADANAAAETNSN
ncbi:MAG: phosphotransferase [Synergistaceae bacterium]|nr:phosphotransferase [Synergistaceae bacterium]